MPFYTIMWGLAVSIFLWILDHLFGYIGKKKKVVFGKSLLSNEITTNQRKLQNLKNKVNKGLREGKNSLHDTYDFQRPEITVSFETKNYKSLSPFEDLPRNYLEKLEKYYHKLSKLEEGWNSFVEGEPLGPKIKLYPPNSSPRITKERGYALEVKLVTTISMELGEELLFFLEDQETDENAPRVEYVDREGVWWEFWK